MNILRKHFPIVQYCNKHTRTKCDFFITTPIYYVNSSPHIGHLYSSLIADATHRYNCMLKKIETIFTTGTDEHGTKIQQAANELNKPLKQFCNDIAQSYYKMNHVYDIGYTHFIRTTNSEHFKAVQEFWKVLALRGHISSGTYQGWYCDADESFLAEHQIKTIKDTSGNEIKVSTESGRPVNWVEEHNYKFQLSKFKDDLKHWLTLERSIQPEKFRRQVLHWINENGITDEDISISRPASRVHWAIPVPEDKSQTIYVWLDALVNYLTIIGYPNLQRWPPDVQVIGKDILKFHAIYWPAFLIAAGLEPPSTLLVHSHWTVHDEKMSKSKGNIVCPFDAANKYYPTGLRYFLLREGTPHSDSNYSDSKVLRILNSELADTLGNLLSRCCAKAINKEQTFPSYNEEDFNLYCRNKAKDLISIVDSLPDEVGQHYSEFNFYKGISCIMATLREANRYFETTKPWELVKSPKQQDNKHLNAILYLTMETLRICALLLNPIVPEISTKLLNKFNIPNDQRMWSNTRSSWNQNILSSSFNLDKNNIVLFKRIQI